MAFNASSEELRQLLRVAALLRQAADGMPYDAHLLFDAADALEVRASHLAFGSPFAEPWPPKPVDIVC